MPMPREMVNHTLPIFLQVLIAEENTMAEQITNIRLSDVMSDKYQTKGDEQGEISFWRSVSAPL